MVIRADIHVHPLLNRWLFGRDPSVRHHCPPFFLPLYNYVDFPRAHAGGVRLLCSIIYMMNLPWRNRMDEIEKLIGNAEAEAKHSGFPVNFVRTAAEVRASAERNELAVIHCIEGAHVIRENEDELERLAALGVRYITLVHFIHSRIGGAAGVPFGGRRGLTDFGRRVVRKMYANGIIADVSHTTEPTFWGVIEEATGPVIASHSGARAFALRDRNLSRDQIQAIAGSGGVVGLLLCPFYLKNFRLSGSLDLFLRHVEYIADLVGPKHIAIGSDFDGWLWPVREVKDIEYFKLIADALQMRGYSDKDIDLIMGESFVGMLERFDAAIGK